MRTGRPGRLEAGSGRCGGEDGGDRGGDEGGGDCGASLATSVLATGSTIGEDGAGVAGKSSDRSSSSASRPGMPTGTEDRSVGRNGVGTTISGDRANEAVGATNRGL